MNKTYGEAMKGAWSNLIALQPELLSKKADETENSSEKQIREKPPESSAESPPTTKGVTRIVNVTRQNGRGWVITSVRSPAQLREERKRALLDESAKFR